VNTNLVIPWDTPEWDEYVASHPGGGVYHTSAWIRTVCEAGGYDPVCVVARDLGNVAGLLPAVAIESRLTGRRLTTIPFSDRAGVLAESAQAAGALLTDAEQQRKARRLSHHELRDTPRLADGTELAPGDGWAADHHFYNYLIPLGPDPEAVKATFSRKAVRQTINKGVRLGVTVRRGEGKEDLRRFYHLYALNRKRHGIPPQPIALFETILDRFHESPQALLYLAEAEGRAVASLIVIRYKGVCYAKYEGIDDSARHLQPIYPLFWETIRDACENGDRVYDFGRTASDNQGLMDFKRRWGTEEVSLPYYSAPPGEALSTVRSDSLKYRLFTGTFQRLPLGVSAWIGARIFRHFG
jgi:FemAB-related protein (PEP-CTERM system-associated)